MPLQLSRLVTEINALDPRRFEGRVTGLSGALIEVSGPLDALALGARARILGAGDAQAEIVGFRGDRALLAPFDSIEAIRPGLRVTLDGGAPLVRPTKAWLGRVIDCFGLAGGWRRPAAAGDTGASCACGAAVGAWPWPRRRAA